jgi:hypothetical protein
VSDHRLRLRALLSQPRIARFAAVAVLCMLLQLLIRRIRARDQRKGVTFFMAARNEAANLRAIVPGIATGLGTRHGLIGFCDADGQFEIESFGTPLAPPDECPAAVCADYRIARAGPLARRLTGQGPRDWAGRR